MTCKTSAVAVCCSNASRVSVISRAFSIAMTAWFAKLETRASCLSLNDWGSRRRRVAGLTSPDRREIGRHVEHRDVAESLALIEEHSAEHAIAEPARIAEHRVEYGLQLAGAGRDDAQYLGGGGLLLQRLARLGHAAAHSPSQ